MYFGGASKIDQIHSGVGGVLYMSKNYKFQLRANLGKGTNKFADLFALNLLRILHVEKNLKSLYIVGDPKLAIDWLT